jgi:mxaA protein
MRRGPRLLCGAVLVAVLAAARATEPAVPTLVPQDPRAFGWQIGDPVLRSVELNLPAGHRLDLESLPAAGVPGGAVELRRLERDGAADAPRQRLRLHYQLMSSAEQPRL